MIKILTVTLSLFSSSVVVGVAMTDERGWSIVTCSVTVTVVGPIHAFVHQTIACIKRYQISNNCCKTKETEKNGLRYQTGIRHLNSFPCSECISTVLYWRFISWVYSKAKTGKVLLTTFLFLNS